MSENLWNELEEFWDNGGNIEEKAEKYQELYENPKSEEEFSWGHHQDEKLKKKYGDGAKALHWGVPNHVLGDIDKAKVVIGLLNPRTQTEESKNCKTVGEYIREERKSENNEDESNEFYLDNTEDKQKLHKFYREHILSDKNVLSKEIIELYNMYNKNPNKLEYYSKNREDDDNKEKAKEFSAIAYYLKNYYSHTFNGTEAKYQVALRNYLSIFKKMDKAQLYRNDIEEKFEKALNKIEVANIELIPYRSFDSNSLNTLDNLESSKLSAKIIIEKIKSDKDVIVILRGKKEKSLWEKLLENICENREDVNYERDIAPFLYKFSSTQNAAISKGNIVPYLGDGNDKKVEMVIDEIRDIISLKDFEQELDDIISENS